MSKIDIGKKAPQFTLEGTGGSWSLSDAAGGTVVIYFYPRDNTPGCTQEGADFSAAHAQFKKARALIVGISADLGWERLRNGDLLAAAERAGYELLLTTDKNLRYQQNLRDRMIAVVVIGHAQWPTLEPYAQRVVEAVNVAVPGSYAEVDVPFR